MLWVLDERRPPRALRRAVEQRGFADLMPLPAPQPPRVFAPVDGIRAHRAGMALAGAVTALLVTLTPQHAATPELPNAVRMRLYLEATLQPQRPVAEPSVVLMANDSPRDERESSPSGRRA